MPYALRFALAALATLAGLALAAFSVAAWMGERKLARTVEVRVVPVAFVKDAASVRLGKYLFETRGCAHCHGADGRGAVVFEDGSFVVKAPDITPGGAAKVYTEADWVRAVRHGVSPAGRALIVMPSEDYNRMNDGDFAALVAYARSLPPGPGTPAQIRMPLMVKALYAAGLVLDSTEKIDHRLPPSQPVPVGATVEHGAYVAQMCTGCHGATYSGGKIPGLRPIGPRRPTSRPARAAP